MPNLIPYILLLPLLGAVINATAGWKLPRRLVEVIACAAVGGSFVFSLVAWTQGHPTTVVSYDWLSFSTFSAPVSLYMDSLSGTMAIMVSGISFLIHVYSVGYMREEDGYSRFFALMNLFVFMMLLLVVAGNLVVMFVGWEGVGFCSYGLIGFWYKKPENAAAGIKAFIVTRIGDVGFGLALVWLFYAVRSVSIPEINASAGMIPVGVATGIGLLLLIGAAGKSAQLPLTVWLPDAMAGPTPVSALIHAATMVTAGVYLLLRMFPVISRSSDALAAVATVGAVTAFYAATAATAQSDIKKVLAYSTISQVGLMLLGVGAGSVDGALFHLFIHAGFKALLFLGAGCIIHALRGEQDIFRMGGLWRRMPLVFWCFLAGSLALAAVPLTGGFFSKDEILEAAFTQGSGLFKFLWLMAEATSFLTAYYISRLVILVFVGNTKIQPHNIPGVMSLSLVPLALVAVVGGAMNLPGWLGVGGGQTGGYGSFIRDMLTAGGLMKLPPETTHGIPLAVTAIAVSGAGIFTAYYLYIARPVVRGALVGRYHKGIDFLREGWYIDRLYNMLFVAGFARLAEILWHSVDAGVIDRFIDNTGSSVANTGTWLRGIVTGRASTYIMATVVGAVFIMAWFAWSALNVS